MKAKTRRSLAAIILATSTLTLVSGCQTAGEVVSKETSPVCPQCEETTVTSSIKGLTYKKHACPSCKVVTEEIHDDSHGSEIVSVHYCSACESIVEPCPMCKTK